MTIKIEETLNSILLDAAGTVGEAKDFLLSEIPDVAQQALLYHGVRAAVGMVAGVLLLFLVPYLFYCFRGKDGSAGTFFDANGEAADYCPATSAVCFALMIYSLCLFNLEWLKIWLAPKLWLVEYAASLVK